MWRRERGVARHAIKPVTTQSREAALESLAPHAGSLFLGDYMGLKRAGDAVYPAFGMTVGPNQTDIFTRRIEFERGRFAQD